MQCNYHEQTNKNSLSLIYFVSYDRLASSAAVSFESKWMKTKKWYGKVYTVTFMQIIIFSSFYAAVKSDIMNNFWAEFNYGVAVNWLAGK